MSCINKASKEYKALQNVYGDALSEAFVRGYPLNKGRSQDMTFEIPSTVEVKDWLTDEKNRIPAMVKKSLTINPYLSENAIKSLLKGVVSKYNDVYFITTGWLFSGSIAFGSEVFKTIYRPNKAVMQNLQKAYPDIFTLKETNNLNTTIVEITPRLKPEVSESIDTDEDTEPEIATSIREYKSIVEMNNGRKPVEFIAGNFRWRLNQNSLYNLVDKDSASIYLRNIDLNTGEIVPEIDPDAPLDEAKRDRIFRSVLLLIKEQNFDEYLAIKGIDTVDIYEDLRDAKTDRDLNKVLETLMKAVC